MTESTLTKDDKDAQVFAGWFDRLVANIETVIKGKTDVVRLVLIALFAEGHLLLEDVPGVGKTMLARSLAQSLDAEWRRVQFTPDLLPSDVTGVSIWNQKSEEFEFHHGPVFANIALADEINRASPKTQAALLEVMEERNVTVDGVAHPVPRPFLVIATQNPIELEGTYRLPEAQLDRFLIRTSMGAPDLATEIEILRTHSNPEDVPLDDLPTVMDAELARRLVAFASRVHVSDSVFGYVAALADATRRLEELRLGASPRASLGLVRACRVMAAAEGRTFVTPEDVKFLAEPVLAHRIILTPEAELQGRNAGDLVNQAVASLPVPTSRD